MTASGRASETTKSATSSTPQDPTVRNTIGITNDTTRDSQVVTDPIVVTSVTIRLRYNPPVTLPTDEHLKGSAVRLWHLIEERMKPGADRERIDRRIWDLFGERWAVMFTDLSGFSRRVAAFGIIHFLQVIHEQKRLLLPAVAEHDGILIKVEADSFLVLFKDAEKALRAGVAMQHASAAYNHDRAPEDRVLLCVGLGYGDLIRIGDDDVFGREVNSAAKLGEDRAQPGEILLTDAVRTAVGDLPGLGYEAWEGQEVAGSPVNWRLKY